MQNLHSIHKFFWLSLLNAGASNETNFSTTLRQEMFTRRCRCYHGRCYLQLVVLEVRCWKKGWKPPERKNVFFIASLCSKLHVVSAFSKPHFSITLREEIFTRRNFRRWNFRESKTRKLPISWKKCLQINVRRLILRNLFLRLKAWR